MKKIYSILFLVVLIFCSCEFKLKPNSTENHQGLVEVQRFDRLESRYLTTGDYSALQQMNTNYPMETRTLIEDVLKLGDVNDAKIYAKFLSFYQDSVLQVIISDAEEEYACMDDINKALSNAFSKLQKYLPNVPPPNVYAQVGDLAQSIVVAESSIGISLDKYLGKNYPIYKKYYTETQRQSMTRNYIVPDCMMYYILSLYPMNKSTFRSKTEQKIHIGKIMWITNKVLGKHYYNSEGIDIVNCYMKKHKQVSITTLLTLADNEIAKEQY